MHITKKEISAIDTPLYIHNKVLTEFCHVQRSFVSQINYAKYCWLI